MSTEQLITKIVDGQNPGDIEATVRQIGTEGAQLTTPVSASGTDFNVDGEGDLQVDVKTAPSMTISNEIDETGYDLNAAAFNETTNITNDFILDSVELNFSTTEVKTITILSSDGTIIWGGSVDTSEDNLGYNTTKRNFVLKFGLAFDEGNNITVQVTQTSGACLLDCVLKIKQGQQPISGNTRVEIKYNTNVAHVSDENELYVANTPFGLRIGDGKMPGHTAFILTGRNEDVDAGDFEDVWDYGGKYVFLSSDTQLYASSTSTNDTQPIYMQDIHGDFELRYQLLPALNGQNQVAFPYPSLRVNEAFTFGSVATEGDIYIAEADSLTGGIPDTPSKIKAVIRQINQKTHMAVYTVPRNYVAFFNNIYTSINKGKDASLWYGIRLFDKPFYWGSLIESYQNTSVVSINYIGAAAPRSDILIRAYSYNDDTRLSITAPLILKEQEVT